MQRQIKFRGKRLDGDGSWVYGDLLQQESGNVTIMVHEESNWHQPSQVDPETVGQYTGLTDTHKVDIYENDIVKGEYTWNGHYLPIGRVMWHEGAGAWYISDESADIFEPLSDQGVCEVLGNLTDTPDLVEGGRAV